MGPVEPLTSAQLPAALACLLAPPGGGKPAGSQQVQGFLDYLATCPIRWEGLRSGLGPQPTGLFLALLLPGYTAIVMIPTSGELGIQGEAQRRITALGMDQLRTRKLHYAQALLLPGATTQRDLLTAFGFRPLAPLVYLERDVTYPWIDPPDVAAESWQPFGSESYSEFATTLLATYQDSLDCPELTGLRPVDDIIAAHQACGTFEPSLWELLRLGGQVAGCLLLARLARGSALEVVYMGVVPACRGRGIGELLLRRALERCREVRARRLTLVVDDRNGPAKRLYARMGLQAMARRDAYLQRRS